MLLAANGTFSDDDDDDDDDNEGNDDEIDSGGESCDYNSDVLSGVLDLNGGGGGSSANNSNDGDNNSLDDNENFIASSKKPNLYLTEEQKNALRTLASTTTLDLRQLHDAAVLGRATDSSQKWEMLYDFDGVKLKEYNPQKVSYLSIF